MLANQYMNRGNCKLAIRCLCEAETLASEDIVKLDLNIRKAKAMIGPNENPKEIIAAFKKVLSMYDGGLNHHRLMNDRFVGKLAVAEYQLVQCLVSKGRVKEASHHFKEAEKKRKSIPRSVAATVDWSNQTNAQMVLGVLKTGDLTMGECDHCGKTIMSGLKKCSACKVFYCGRGCQVASWKGGHRDECKTLQET